MTGRLPLSFEPEPLDYALTHEERSQLVGFALGRAALWAIGAAAVWFALRGFMASDESSSTGIAFVTLVFAIVFFWKRRSYRREMEEVIKAAKAKESANQSTQRSNAQSQNPQTT